MVRGRFLYSTSSKHLITRYVFLQWTTVGSMRRDSTKRLIGVFYLSRMSDNFGGFVQKTQESKQSWWSLWSILHLIVLCLRVPLAFHCLTWQILHTDRPIWYFRRDWRLILGVHGDMLGMVWSVHTALVCAPIPRLAVQVLRSSGFITLSWCCDSDAISTAFLALPHNKKPSQILRCLITPSEVA